VISDLSASPATQHLGGSVNLTADITDNIGLSSVYVHILKPDSSSMNVSVLSNQIGSTFYYQDTYDLLGNYEYYFWAEDSTGNTKKSGTASFLISDDEQPQITNVLVTQADPVDTEPGFGWTNFSCRVVDDELSLVKLHLIKPDTSIENISLYPGSAGVYYYNTTLEDYGNYSWYFWVNDTSNNQNSTTSAKLSVSPNWDINEDGSATVFDLTLISNHYNETGSPGWIREDVDNNGAIEVLDIVLSANEYSKTWWV
jgi:hypothetical protein